jgi:hypothetical protein
MGNITETCLREGPGVSLPSLISLKKLSSEEMKAYRLDFCSREEKQK